ncbi:flavanone 3-dioxygenase 2-like [Aristolochia californica]|uniref:flavanone 3-dioxygenase 2-like n=1 Tax=Aristolochia californica TaxID=171875 RepID=UPI0035E31A74
MAAPSTLLAFVENAVTDDSKKGVKHLVDTRPNLKTIPPQYILPVALRPLSVSPSPLPVVDLSGLHGAPASRELTVRHIKLTCQEWGFFRIVNHGVRDSLTEEMMRTVEAFFSLPWEEKAKYASNDVMSTVRYGTSMNTPKPHVLQWRDYLRHYGHPFSTSFYLWPDRPQNYRPVAKEYLEEIWKVVMDLVGAISEGLGLERTYVEESMGEVTQILAANYYPPCPQPELTLGLSPHSDHGGLTILVDNGVTGLQVKHDNDWVSVPHVPGSFLVNIGDYLEILSNGRYKSVEHRAVVNNIRTRISIAAGHGPQLSASIGPARRLVERDGEPKYKTMTYSDFMRDQQSSVSRGKTALEAVKSVIS